MHLLKDLKIDRNTMVVFTSDNGPSVESYLPEKYEPTFFNSFGPFDGIKRDVWEGGVRMPTLVQWPGQIPANQVIDKPSAHYDWLATFADVAHVPAPARTDGVSLLPTLIGKGQQKQGVIYIEYENIGNTPSFGEFSPNHRDRKRNQMQKLRLGDYVGVRYNIQSSDDDFEIYNVVKDPQESKNVGQEAAYQSMQKTFKEKVIQLRRPDPEAPRPYDLAPIAAAKPPKLATGIGWSAHEGPFPWVADLNSRPATRSGIKPTIELSNTILKKGMICQRGYLRIPKDGLYQFSMNGNGSFVLRLHETLLFDHSFPDQSKLTLPLSARVNLKAGHHPFRLYYYYGGRGKPSLDWTWQGDGLTEQSIPSTALFHEVDN